MARCCGEYLPDSVSRQRRLVLLEQKLFKFLHHGLKCPRSVDSCSGRARCKAIWCGQAKQLLARLSDAVARPGALIVRLLLKYSHDYACAKQS